MACNCQKVMVFLRQIGATHAAEMHKDPKKAWSARDWLLHFMEEEELLWPIFYQTGHGFVVAELNQEHAIFRSEIARYGRIISTGLLDQHARTEDETVECILRSR